MKFEYHCETCGKPGKIRQPKQKYKNPNSIIPDSTDICFFNLVVRCDEHCGNDMQ